MKKEKIVLGMPNDADIYKVIKKSIENLGFEVILLSPEYNFRYKNRKQHIIAFLRKVFLRDKNYKNKLKKEYYNEVSLEKIERLENKSVLSLVIRADIFDIKLIEILKQKSKVIIGYQWDGLDRFKSIIDYIPLFDKFYVFEEKDINKYSQFNLELTHNFYFDTIELKESYKNIESEKLKAYFLGYPFEDRIIQMISLGKLLIELGVNLNIRLILIYKYKRKYKDITYLNFMERDETISYLDNLQEAYNSDILLDFSDSNFHKGLSFRPFEALGFNKKLITNNSLIKKHDFYNPNNIFIWTTNSSIEDIKIFLEKPYEEIPYEIKQKYSFTYWFKQIFNLEDSY